jgi:hypothetical protein
MILTAVSADVVALSRGCVGATEAQRGSGHPEKTHPDVEFSP